MKSIRLFPLLVIVFFSHSSSCQIIEKNQVTLNKKKFTISITSLALVTGGLYYYVNNSWWSDESIDFHFDQGPDLTYAMNVDKAAHFFGGLVTADMFSRTMIWSGIQEDKAYLYGSLFGSALQLGIEIKDGYAPYWGFSKVDLLTGVVGSFSPYLKQKYPTYNVVNFKIGYFKRSNHYWDLENQRGKFPGPYDWHNDYVNQTYWMALDIKRISNQSWWPDFLDLAIGFGLDDSQFLNNQNRKSGGCNEWYLAIDYNLPKLLKNLDSPLAKELKYWLNYIKFPAPTLRFSPTIEFYPFFM